MQGREEEGRERKTPLTGVTFHAFSLLSFSLHLGCRIFGIGTPLTIHKIMVNPNESGWDMALCVGDTGDSQKNLLSTGAEEVDLKEMLPVLKEQLTLC